MTPLEEADRAVFVLREAIKAATDLVGLPHPLWVNDDSDRGWQGAGGGFKGTATATILRAGAREDDPKNVRITYVLQGQEHLTEIAPSGTPHAPLLDKLLGSLNIPVETVRAYCGSVLLEERKTKMRI